MKMPALTRELLERLAKGPENTEPLPCPFCGHKNGDDPLEPKLDCDGDIDGAYINCENCGARGRPVYVCESCEDDARNTWNTRPLEQQMARALLRMADRLEHAQRCVTPPTNLRDDALSYIKDALAALEGDEENAGGEGREPCERTSPPPCSASALTAQPERPLADMYNELLYAVARKFPGESRHETALRYIRQAEEVHAGPCMQNKE